MKKGSERVRTMLGLGVLLVWCAYAAALNPSLDVSQYAHNSWKRTEGFSAGAISKIAQLGDGYLWLAAESGLFRFDGVRAVKWQPPPGQHLPSNDIRGLLAARDGSLWLGTPKGVARWEGGKITAVSELDGYDVYAMVQDHEGTIWAGGVKWEQAFWGKGRLCAIKPAHVQCWGSDGSLGFGPTALYEDSHGTLWAGSGNGLWRWKPGPPKRYPLPEKELGTTDAIVFTRNGIIEGEHGELLLAAFRGVVRFLDGKSEPFPFPASPPDLKQSALLRDRDGGLWISSEDAGLIHLHKGRMDLYTAADGLSGNSVLSMFEDREGSIWIATSNGLDRFREYAIPSISTKQGLSSPFVECVLAAQDGTLWLGTSDGLNHWDHGQVTIYRKASEPASGNRHNSRARGGAPAPRAASLAHEVRTSGLPDNFVLSLFQDSRGRIWITTFGGLSYFEAGKINRFTGLPFPPQNPVVQDNKGYLWTAQSDLGLVRMRKWKLVEQVPWNKLGIAGALSNPLVADPVDGGVWVGSWGEGVIHYRDGQVLASYSSKDGLGEGRINSLRMDKDDTLWAATESGLSRIKDGRANTLSDQNGLPCDTVHDAIEDDLRALWVQMSCGLVRIQRDELNAWVAEPKRKIQISFYDSSDGVNNHAEVYNFGPRVAKTTDGKLWISPMDGILIVDPLHLASNKVPPPVQIEKITADGKAYAPVLHGRVLLPARVRNLSIDFTALSFAAPEKVQFRYKLDGQDGDWRVAINARQAQYTNLPPRVYRFRVIGCNNSGVWNQEGDHLEFSVAPAYYQTIWFRVLCALLLLAVLWGTYLLRIRQLHREFALTLEARVGERTRIAREIHDTLLQSVQGLLLQLRVVSQLQTDRPAEAIKRLENTIEWAANAITEGRDAVQGLRESTVQQNNLARAVQTLGEQLAADCASGEAPAFRVTVERTSRDLHPIVRDEIYRIAAEALRNAFSHAKARQIEVEIRYDDESFRLRVRDDGKGVDTSVMAKQARSGHYGLPGMRERAAGMGGDLTVWSQVNAGTEVDLTLPAATAYLESGRGRWFSRTLAGKR